jgi:hypothetical protein
MWRAFPQRGGRAVDEHSEIYVGLDVAIARHAVAVADGERSSFRVATLVGRFATRLRRSVVGRVSRTHRLSTPVRNCTRDEGGPFEIGSQVQVSSHRKLLS